MDRRSEPTAPVTRELGRAVQPAQPTERQERGTEARPPVSREREPGRGAPPTQPAERPASVQPAPQQRNAGRPVAPPPAPAPAPAPPPPQRVDQPSPSPRPLPG